MDFLDLNGNRRLSYRKGLGGFGKDVVRRDRVEQVQLVKVQLTGCTSAVQPPGLGW